MNFSTHIKVSIGFAAALVALVACERTVMDGSLDFIGIGDTPEQVLSAAARAGCDQVWPDTASARAVKLGSYSPADASYLAAFDHWKISLASEGHGLYHVYFQNGRVVKVQRYESPIELP